MVRYCGRMEGAVCVRFLVSFFVNQSLVVVNVERRFSRRKGLLYLIVGALLNCKCRSTPCGRTSWLELCCFFRQLLALVFPFVSPYLSIFVFRFPLVLARCFHWLGKAQRGFLLAKCTQRRGSALRSVVFVRMFSPALSCGFELGAGTRAVLLRQLAMRVLVRPAFESSAVALIPVFFSEARLPPE